MKIKTPKTSLVILKKMWKIIKNVFSCLFEDIETVKVCLVEIC